MKNFKLISKTTYEDAIKLVSDRGWKFDYELDELIVPKKKSDFQKFYEEYHINRSLLVSANKLPKSPFAISQHIIQKEGELLEIYPETAPYIDSLTGRVKPNAVFHVSKAINEILVRGIGLFFAYLNPVCLASLYYAWLAYSFSDFVNKLCECYIEIKNPDHQIVFEAVFKLQNQLCIINYDALQKRDFDKAYGKISPSTQEIVEAISGHLPTERINDILYDLNSREILNEKNGRWAIDFSL